MKIANRLRTVELSALNPGDIVIWHDEFCLFTDRFTEKDLATLINLKSGVSYLLAAHTSVQHIRYAELHIK